MNGLHAEGVLERSRRLADAIGRVDHEDWRRTARLEAGALAHRSHLRRGGVCESSGRPVSSVTVEHDRPETIK
ncbi:hypothetical protein ACFQMM_06670 [Saliphagus sp. GCM10025308]